MRHLFAEHPPLPALESLHAYRWLVVATVCVGAFLGQLDASIASLILPTLEDRLRAPVANVEWVSVGYLLTLAALVVPLGRLADLAGRKTLYTWGFVVFIVGSALCGFAPGLGWLIAFRVLQAVGAAMLQANSVAIVTAAVSHQTLGRAIGVQGAAQAIGLSVGPSLGGVLIDALGWRWVFFIAVPFGVVGTVLAWLVLPRTRSDSPSAPRAQLERFDWIGGALLGPAAGMALLAITYGNTWGWTSRLLIGVLTVAMALVVGFVVTERKARSPLVDATLFRSRLFSTGIVAGLLSYAVLFGSLFVMPFYLEPTLGYGASQTGLLLTPVPIALAVMAPVAGIVTDRVGSRLPTVAGMLVAAAALLALALLPGSSLVTTLASLALLGVGLGLFTPANNSAIMGSAPRNRLGVAGGVLNMARSLGTSLGVAATGAVLAVLLTSYAGMPIHSTLDAPPAALLSALRDTLLFMAAVALAAALLSSARTDRSVASAETTSRRAAIGEGAGL